MGKTPFKVPVDQIGVDGFALDVTLPHSWLEESLFGEPPSEKGSAVRPEGDGHLTIRLTRVGDKVYARGGVRVALVGSCARCLDAAMLVLDRDIEVALWPSGKEPAASGDGEVQVEDMGISTYEDRAIDLANLVRDEVFLALPMRPLCRETCAGLCPHCGGNRNLDKCACSAPMDPRWAALAQHGSG